MLPRRPVYIRQLDPAVGVSLARLSALEGLSRSTILGVLPLIALEAFEDKGEVSLAYVGGAIIATMVTLNLGTVERFLSRKWTITVGLLALITASLVFAMASGPILAIGIGLQAIASAIFSVGITLYIMDFVAKAELTRNESRRMVYNGAAWLIGPSLGIWLWDNVGPSAPFIASIGFTTVTIAVFWYLRLSSYPVLTDAKSQASNPFKTIPRFFAQRHLRIAYAITFTRSVYWAAVFVYGPIYVREAGLANWVAGAFLSGLASLLLTAPLVYRMVTNFGVRAITIASFALITLGTAALGLLGPPRPIGLAFWALASIGAGAIDVVGNVPFMRLVKPRERIPMTTVFSTWRQTSALAAPAFAALVLAFAPFEVYFLVLAVLSAAAIAATSYLPKRLS